MFIEIQGHVIDTKQIESVSSIVSISIKTDAFYINMKSRNFIKIDTATGITTTRLKSLHTKVIQCFRGIYEIHKID